MITKRYVALNLIPLITLLLGLAVLAAPDPFRGPCLSFPAFHSAEPLGLMIVGLPSIYFSHVLGLIMLAVAVGSIWVIALAWQYRRLRHPH